jgi:hypothetical protein
MTRLKQEAFSKRFVQSHKNNENLAIKLTTKHFIEEKKDKSFIFQHY